MQQQVRMGIDKARQQRRARQLDEFAPRCSTRCPPALRLDAIIAAPDRPALMHGSTIEHARQLQDDDPVGVTAAVAGPEA